MGKAAFRRPVESFLDYILGVILGWAVKEADFEGNIQVRNNSEGTSTPYLLQKFTHNLSQIGLKKFTGKNLGIFLALFCRIVVRSDSNFIKAHILV